MKMIPIELMHLMVAQQQMVLKEIKYIVLINITIVKKGVLYYDY